MKRQIALAIIASLLATAAYAACRTYTILKPDGTIVVCTECCTNNNCTLTCF